VLKKKGTEGQLFSSDIFFGKCPTLYNRNCGGIIRFENAERVQITSYQCQVKTKNKTGTNRELTVFLRQSPSAVGRFLLISQS